LPRSASAFVELIRGVDGKPDAKTDSGKNGKAEIPPES
jgi:hypothetical protein